jgi:CRISPR/Cas system Type II protein with McrA/HNH and RuvC-like nuclease domain
MKGLDWGIYFNKYSSGKYDPKKLESRFVELLEDEDVTNQKGIYEYLLDGKEKHLSIRAFSPKMARTAYERQKGICPKCGKHFEIEEMQADHITPWSKGGKTTADNCQMLCADCNRRKSDM